MFTKFVITAAISFATLAGLQGCASSFNPVGESKFDCNRKQDPSSPYCKSFKAVEASTRGDVPQSRFDKEFTMSERDRLLKIAPDDETVAPTQGQYTNGQPSTAPAPAPAKVILPHQVRTNLPLDGQPVREGPLVQRVWIKRFVDGNDVLTENVTVYKEIRANRWAGFEKTAQSQPTAQAYPHRPPAAEVTLSGLSAKPQVFSEFKQPGASQVNGSAPEPAVSGSTSMPQ